MQYLPVVMEPLLKVASIQPEITFIDCEWAGWMGWNVSTRPQGGKGSVITFEDKMTTHSLQLQ